MKISIIGTGYVGLVTGVSLAAIGNEVICIGRTQQKIDDINNAVSPFYEPGLDELLRKVNKVNGFHASADLDGEVRASDVIIIAVGTPTVKKKIDLNAIKTVAKQIGIAIKTSNKYHVVVVKSTVLPGVTEDVVAPLVEQYSGKKRGEFGLCMNPEFLREGCAVEDAMNPDRVVIGCFDEKSGKTLKKVYRRFTCPILLVSIKTAELTKYAANALFATLISYSNEIARISETIKDVDVVDVWQGVHLDKRLTFPHDQSPIKKGRVYPGSVSYIFSGCGYGGSCFPKDTKAIASFAQEIGQKAHIIDEVIHVNETQPLRIITLLRNHIKNIKGKKIAILGLAFKPDTDDLRESPSLPIYHNLVRQGAKVVVHDPQAYKKYVSSVLEGMILAKTIDEALEKADAVILMTSWNEYKKLKPSYFKNKMKKALVIDGRRMYNRAEFEAEGVVYSGIGYNKS